MRASLDIRRSPSARWSTASACRARRRRAAAASRGVEVVGVDARERGQLALAELATDAGFAVLRRRRAPRRCRRWIAVVLSPGVPADQPLLAAARARGMPVIAEVELAFPFLRRSDRRRSPAQRQVHHHRADRRAARGCGPASSRSAATSARRFRHVSTAPAGRSSWSSCRASRLETIDTFQPRAAALLNLSPDHLDRYGAMDDYARGQEADLPAPGAGRRRGAERRRSQVAATVRPRPARRYFSTAAARSPTAASSTATRWSRPSPDGRRTPSCSPRADVPLAGVHNLENAMAAALLARAVGRSSRRRSRAGLRELPRPAAPHGARSARRRRRRLVRRLQGHQPRRATARRSRVSPTAACT